MANAKASPNLEALPTSPSLAQTLPSDALKMILLGAPLNEVLTTITRLIEAHNTGMLCSIFLLAEDGLHLRYGVAARLPEAYRAAIDGICIGPNVGSCGTAAYLRQPVLVSDIASDPRWVKFRHFALQNGLRAAWSAPIMSHNREVLGTFCMDYREVRHPGPGEIQLIDYASRIAGIAIEQKRAEEKLRQDERELRQLMDFLPQHVLVLDAEGFLLQAVGHRSSMPRIISSAQRTASAIALIVAGTRFAPSYATNFRAAGIEAMIPMTRLQDSSTEAV